LKAGEQDAAYEALRQWLDAHPQDTRLRTMLAMALQSAGQQQSAIDEYLHVLEHDADNVTVLNNLAWLYQETGNPEGVKYAERAHDLVPGRPDVSDTLGWLLVQNGDINRGLVLLQEAAVKAPHIPDIRYHMIVALDKAGRRDEARKELDRLLKTGKTFPDVDKARALREQWGG
jgi:Tfp pilus assembly protein PilF